MKRAIGVVVLVLLVAGVAAATAQEPQRVSATQALTATGEALTRLSTQVTQVRDIVAQYEQALAYQQRLMSDAVAALDSGDEEALRAAVEAMRVEEE